MVQNYVRFVVQFRDRFVEPFAESKFQKMISELCPVSEIIFGTILTSQSMPQTLQKYDFHKVFNDFTEMSFFVFDGHFDPKYLPT